MESEPQPITGRTNDDYRLMIMKNPCDLANVPSQTDELCELAVSLNYRALKFVRKQKLNLCMSALLDNAAAIVYVDGRFYAQVLSSRFYENSYYNDICMHAVQENPYLIRYMDKPSEDVVAYSMAHKAYPTDTINELPDKNKLEILKINASFFPLIKKPTTEMCNVAMRSNGLLLEKVPSGEQTVEMQTLALQQNPDSWLFIKKCKKTKLN